MHKEPRPQVEGLQPRPVPDANLRLTRLIDEVHLQYPYYAARCIAKQLAREGIEVGRLHVSILKRRMGVEVRYHKPRTRIPAHGAVTRPYQLEGLSIERPNQLRATGITYLPITRRPLYLKAIPDIASRFAALKKAPARFAVPEILNTDQGCQFTSEDRIKRLEVAGFHISMDRKDRWVDNVFVERLWRRVKYEHVHLYGYRGGREARERLTAYFDTYSRRHPHRSLDYRTPDEAYFGAGVADLPLAA